MAMIVKPKSRKRGSKIAGGGKGFMLELVQVTDNSRSVKQPVSQPPNLLH